MKGTPLVALSPEKIDAPMLVLYRFFYRFPFKPYRFGAAGKNRQTGWAAALSQT